MSSIKAKLTKPNNTLLASSTNDAFTLSRETPKITKVEFALAKATPTISTLTDSLKSLSLITKYLEVLPAQTSIKREARGQLLEQLGAISKFLEASAPFFEPKNRQKSKGAQVTPEIPNIPIPPESPSHYPEYSLPEETLPINPHDLREASWRLRILSCDSQWQDKNLLVPKTDLQLLLAQNQLLEKQAAQVQAEKCSQNVEEVKPEKDESEVGNEMSKFNFKSLLNSVLCRDEENLSEGEEEDKQTNSPKAKLTVPKIKFQN